MTYILNENEFIRCMDDIEKIIQYNKGLNDFLNIHDVDGYLFQPDCLETVVFLLHKIFNKSDFDEWISYFIFDLEFGKKYKEGMIKDKNGQNIVLKTSRDLYKLLSESEV